EGRDFSSILTAAVCYTPLTLNPSLLSASKISDAYENLNTCRPPQTYWFNLASLHLRQNLSNLDVSRLGRVSSLARGVLEHMLLRKTALMCLCCSERVSN